MNEKDFCYWLQGFFELKKTIDCREGASAETMQVIEYHLKFVFDKKTPDRSKEELDYLSKVITPSTPLPTDFKKLSDLIGKHYEPKDFGPP